MRPNTPAEFDEIRPYEEGEMKQAFEDLLADRQFSRLMQGFVPWLPKALRNALLRLAFTGVKTPLDFQLRFMKPIVWHIMRKHTDGCTFDDSRLTENSELRTERCDYTTENSELRTERCDYTTENSELRTERCDSSQGVQGNHTSHLSPLTSQLRYTFLSNHRDIVLDSAFLDVMLIKHGYPTTVEIGIGDNLLIYPWIKRLVRMNKAFTVRRGLTAHEMMRSSQLMSSYIHYAVTQKRENIWIAQREGRSKDSSDHTQEAVLKMLAMGGDLAELNIVPLTISYEFDPCDYLKAQEFQQKRDNPAFKKSKQDDLDNMRTGIFGYKGRVHYHCGQPVNAWLGELRDLPRKDFFAALCERIDSEIYAGYHLYPCNYIALDELEGTATHQAHYSEKDKQRFEQYLQGQLAKINIPDKDEAFLRERMLTMYANPTRNHLATL